MSDPRGFVLIDVLMQGVAVVGVLTMTAIGAVQVATAVTASPEVLVEIVASGWGWAAAATHPGLEDGAGCALYSGRVGPPGEPTVPPRPGEVVCTD